MSARTARHRTRWDAPQTGACHLLSISLVSFQKSIAPARESLGGIRPFSPALNRMAEEYGRGSITPASRQAQGLGCQKDITGSGQGRWEARRFPTRFATGGALAGAMACMD